ncbi:MAG: hypothetical protein ACR2LS_00570 [Thermomicrobiales bacterium]
MTGETIDRTRLLVVGRRAVISSLLVLVLMVLGGVQQGSAELEWCRVDPLISVNGTTYNVILSSPMSILEAATGPTEVIVTVPEGSEYELISTDAGFGYGETVTFVESSSRSLRNGAGNISIATKVPATSQLPVLVEVIDADQIVATALGRTNQRMSVSVPT